MNQELSLTEFPEASNVIRAILQEAREAVTDEMIWKMSLAGGDDNFTVANRNIWQAAIDAALAEDQPNSNRTRLTKGKLTLEVPDGCKYWYIQNTDKRKSPLTVEFKGRDRKRILDYQLVAPEGREAGAFIDSVAFACPDGLRITLHSSLDDAEVALAGLIETSRPAPEELTRLSVALEPAKDAPARKPPGAAWLACLLVGAIAGLTALGLLLALTGG